MILRDKLTEIRMADCPKITYQTKHSDTELSDKKPLSAQAEITYKFNLVESVDMTIGDNNDLDYVNLVLGDRAKSLKNTLLYDIEANELCAIRADGYIIAMAYIDHEDLFIGNLSNHLFDMLVTDISIENMTYKINGEETKIKVRTINICRI